MPETYIFERRDIDYKFVSAGVGHGQFQKNPFGTCPREYGGMPVNPFYAIFNS